MAVAFTALSPEGQRVVQLLAQLSEGLSDPNARAEARRFLSASHSIDPEGTERALVVLAACDGNLSIDESEVEAVRVIRAGLAG